MKKIIAGVLSTALLLGGSGIPVSAAPESGAEPAAEFYVSPDGSDENAGTEDAPFRTIARARDAVDAINDDMQSDIIVYLMDSTYYQDETLTFDASDSGSNGFKVRYEAYEGASPSISGGKELDGEWELHDAENNIYKISVPDGLNFRQLYVNGEKGIRARTGQAGVFDGSSRICGADRLDEEGNVIPEWWADQGNPATQVQADGGRVIVPDDGRISDEMDNLQEVELHIYTAWLSNILRVDHIEKIDSYDCQAEAQHTGVEYEWDGACWQVYVQEPEAGRIFNRPHPGLDNYAGGPHYAFYYENAYEYIDTDTEWYLDTTDNILYYKAPADMDMSSATAVVPMIEEVVAAEGTLDDPIHDIEFNGITFEHSTWLRPSEEGLVGGQANQDMTYGVFKNNDIGVKRQGAGIRVENAKDIRFEGNTIRYMGATGILLASGTENVTLINNTVKDVAGNGIEVGKFVVDENTDYHQVYNPEDEREVSRYDNILNNEVYNVGTQYPGAIGIAVGYVQGITIANNTIHDCPYSGISVGYGWTSEPSPMKYNKVLKNEIYAVNQLVCDGGAIYTLSNQSPGSYIKDNYLHDNWLPEGADYGANGVYLDEQTSGYSVSDNVLVASYGISLHITGPNDIGTNYTFNGSAGDAGYEGFLTEEVLSIMENAGVQEDFNEETDGGTQIDGAHYDPYYDNLLITGVGFGEGKGTVYFENETETTALTDDDILSWTDDSVTVKLPENIQEGSAVYLETGSGRKTGRCILENLSVKMEPAYEEDFDDTDEGMLSDASWDVTIPEKASVVSDGEGRLMQLTGNGTNLDVTLKGEDGNTRTFGDNVTQFDFRFISDMSDYTGLYNILCRSTESDKIYTVNIRPAYSTKISLEEKGVNETGKGEPSFETGKWYTCRTMVNNGILYASFFPKGEEPAGWDLQRTISGNEKTESVLNFSFYDPGARKLDIDNIKMWTLSDFIEGDKDALQELLNEAGQIDLDKYVEAGQAEYLEAKAAAEAVMDNEEADQEAVNDALTRLTNAMNSLKLKADKSALSALVSSLEDFDAGTYPEGSAEAFIEALESAKNILADETLTEDDQEKVDEATAALRKAKEALDGFSDALELMYEEDFEESEEGLLSDAGWDVTISDKASVSSDDDGRFMQLTGNDPNLDVTLKGEDGNIWTYGDNVTQFDFRFPQDMSGYAGLYMVLCRSLDTDTKYTANIRPAWSITISLEESGVNDQGNASRTFETGKWYSCRTMINNGTLYASFFPKGESPSGWDLQMDMHAGMETESILDFSYYDPDGRPLDIDNIKIWSMPEIQEADKTELQELLGQADQIDLDKYVENGQEEYTEAKEAAENVLNNEDALQEEVDNAVNRLTEAMQGLRLKADKSALEELVESLKDLDLSIYTEESAADLKEALEYAEGILADEALSEDDQETVNSAVASLQAAKDGLAESDGSDDDGKDDETDDPAENPGGSTDEPGGSTDKPGGSTDKPGSSTENPGGSTDKPAGQTGSAPSADTEQSGHTVQTGDDDSADGWMAVTGGSLILIAAAFLARKKFKNLI